MSISWAVRAPYVGAVALSLAAAAVLAGCTHSAVHPSPTSSAPSYLNGDPARISLTGPPQKPIRWTVLPGLTSTRAAVQLALQRFDGLGAVQAGGGIDVSAAAVTAQVQDRNPNFPMSTLDTLAGQVGGGVVWEKVAVVHVAGATALTSVCIDARSSSKAVPAQAVPKVGRSVTSWPQTVFVSTYQWRYGPPRNGGSGPRWRFLTTAFGTTGSPSYLQCQAWAKTHTTWPGPSSG